MQINVPNDLEDNFITFLDLAQSGFTEKEEENFSPGERKCLAFIRNLIKERQGDFSMPNLPRTKERIVVEVQGLTDIHVERVRDD